MPQPDGTSTEISDASSVASSGQRLARAEAKAGWSTRVAWVGQGQWVTIPRTSCPLRITLEPELP